MIWYCIWAARRISVSQGCKRLTKTIYILSGTKYIKRTKPAIAAISWGGVSVRVIANGIPLSILASCNLRVCEWSYFRALAPVGTSPQRKKRQLRLGGFTSTSWASIISKRYGGCNRPTARKFLAVIDWSRTNSRCSGKKNSNSATQNKTEKVFLLSSLLSHALLSDSYTLAIFLVVLL